MGKLNKMQKEEFLSIIRSQNPENIRAYLSRLEEQGLTSSELISEYMALPDVVLLRLAKSLGNESDDDRNYRCEEDIAATALLRLAKSLGNDSDLDPNYVCAEDIAATAWLNQMHNDKKLDDDIFELLEKNSTIISIDSVWNSNYFNDSKSVKSKLYKLYDLGFDSKTILEKVKGSINEPEVNIWLEDFLVVQHKRRRATQKVSYKELYKAGVPLNLIIGYGEFNREEMMRALAEDICSVAPTDKAFTDLLYLVQQLKYESFKNDMVRSIVTYILSHNLVRKLGELSSLIIRVRRADALDLVFDNDEFANYMSRNYNSVETFKTDWDNYITTNEFLELKDDDKTFLKTISAYWIEKILSQRPQQSQEQPSPENRNRQQPTQEPPAPENQNSRQATQVPPAPENQSRRQPRRQQPRVKLHGLLRDMFRWRPARDDTGSTRSREGEGDGEEGPHLS